MLVLALVLLSAPWLAMPVGGQQSAPHVHVWLSAEDGVHDRSGFGKRVARLGSEAGARVTVGRRVPLEADLAGVQTLVIYGPLPDQFRGRQRARLELFQAAGGGLVFVHDALITDEPDWLLEVAGCAYVRGTSQAHDEELLGWVPVAEHPLVQGFAGVQADLPAFENLALDPAARIVVAPLDPGHSAMAAVVAYEHEGRRAVSLAAGHRADEYDAPGLEALLWQAIQWSAHQPLVAHGLPAELPLVASGHPERVVPEGWQRTSFAEGEAVAGATAMTLWGSDLLVAVDGGRRLVILPDANGDGRAEQSREWFAGLTGVRTMTSCETPPGNGAVLAIDGSRLVLLRVQESGAVALEELASGLPRDSVVALGYEAPHVLLALREPVAGVRTGGSTLRTLPAGVVALRVGTPMRYHSAIPFPAGVLAASLSSPGQGSGLARPALVVDAFGRSGEWPRSLPLAGLEHLGPPAPRNSQLGPTVAAIEWGPSQGALPQYVVALPGLNALGRLARGAEHVSSAEAWMGGPETYVPVALTRGAAGEWYVLDRGAPLHSTIAYPRIERCAPSHGQLGSSEPSVPVEPAAFERARRWDQLSSVWLEQETRTGPMTPQLRAALIERFMVGSPLVEVVEHGQEVFRRNCSACHRIDMVGADIAPALDDIGLRDRAYILRSILTPNAELPGAWREHVALDVDGGVHGGVVWERRPERIQLRSPNGTSTLPRAEVEVLRDKAKSLMPENFAALDAGDLAALLGYLEGPRIGWRMVDLNNLGAEAWEAGSLPGGLTFGVNVYEDIPFEVLDPQHAWNGSNAVVALNEVYVPINLTVERLHLLSAGFGGEPGLVTWHLVDSEPVRMNLPALEWGGLDTLTLEAPGGVAAVEGLTLSGSVDRVLSLTAKVPGR